MENVTTDSDEDDKNEGESDDHKSKVLLFIQEKLNDLLSDLIRPSAETELLGSWLKMVSISNQEARVSGTFFPW